VLERPVLLTSALDRSPWPGSVLASAEPFQDAAQQVRRRGGDLKARGHPVRHAGLSRHDGAALTASVRRARGGAARLAAGRARTVR
jgi:hypothetical protein